MLQIHFGLRDDLGNALHPFADIWDALLRRSKLPRDQEIETVREALVVNERVPLSFFELFESEDFTFNVLLQNPEIDAVRTGEIGSPGKAIQLREKNFLPG